MSQSLSLRFMGMELSGAKHERSALCVFDYYPENHRLMLVDLDQGFQGHHRQSSDDVLVAALRDIEVSSPHLSGIAVSNALELPPFFRKYSDAELKWMTLTWEKLNPHPHPFLSYQQRACEIYWRHLAKERFLIPDALGSNAAPIVTRLQYLQTQLSCNWIECFPPATLQRMVGHFGHPKKIIRLYRDLEYGVDQREIFMVHLCKNFPQIFIYRKDLDKIIEELSCFNAFLCGLTFFLQHKKLCEPRPGSFPMRASWIQIPQKRINWSEVF